MGDVRSDASVPLPDLIDRLSLRVLMADSSTKLIRDIRIGDEVVATDSETRQTAARKVTATTIVGTGVKHLVRLGVDATGERAQRAGFDSVKRRNRQ